MEFQSNLITENQIQLDATDAKLLELEEIVERIVDRTKEIPRLGTEIAELRLNKNDTNAKLFGLEKDVERIAEETKEIPRVRRVIDEHQVQTDANAARLLEVDDTVKILKNLPIIDMSIGAVWITRIKAHSYIDPEIIYRVCKSNTYPAWASVIYITGIRGYDQVTHYYAQSTLPCVTWHHIMTFRCLDTLTIIADAYHGFTRDASSDTLKTLVITNITKDGRTVTYRDYPLVSYEWLHRFPSLETLDFSGIPVDLLSTSDIAEFIFLEDFPKLKVIRGVGSKTNMKLVRYCSAKGIVLE
jgi:hypothetical protein